MSDNQAGRPALHWFEIQVADLDRATAFYETILGAKLRRETMGGTDMAIFPYQEPGVGGSLMPGNPSCNGALVYLGCDGDLDAVLARVVPAGGDVVRGRTELPAGMGSFAHVRDSEGNRVGLHSA